MWLDYKKYEKLSPALKLWTLSMHADSHWQVEWLFTKEWDRETYEWNLCLNIFPGWNLWITNIKHTWYTFCVHVIMHIIANRFSSHFMLLNLSGWHWLYRFRVCNSIIHHLYPPPPIIHPPWLSSTSILSPLMRDFSKEDLGKSGELHTIFIDYHFSLFTLID